MFIVFMGIISAVMFAIIAAVNGSPRTRNDFGEWFLVRGLPGLMVILWLIAITQHWCK